MQTLSTRDHFLQAVVFPMSEKFDSERKHLQQEIDELRIQLSLGQADAIDYMEKKKAEFSGFIDETKKQLKESGKPLTEKLSTAEEKLDELKLQLALGRMESADAYHSQKEKIGTAIDHVQKHLRDFGENVETDLDRARDGFEHHAESFKTKLDAAALNVGAGMMLATDEVKDLFSSISDKLHHAKTMTAEEIREARRYVCERIEKHRS